MARTKLEVETNVIEAIKQKRYVNAALKKLFNRSQRQQIKEQSSIEVISLTADW